MRAGSTAREYGYPTVPGRSGVEVFEAINIIVPDGLLIPDLLIPDLVLVDAAAAEQATASP